MSYQPNESRYNQIPYRRCGRSGLKLPEISLGFWQNFGGMSTYENSRTIVRRAFDLGITHMDLANNYGPPAGSAEETIGKILRDDLKAYRDELVISTKAGYYMWPGPYGDLGSRKYLISSLDQSLKRMGLDYVDIFYHHRMDKDTPLEETMGALATAVQQGKALYVGVSNYDAPTTKKASEILKGMGVHCLIHQPYYNMMGRGAEDGLFDVLEEEGIGCIAFSPLAQGLLTSRYLNGVPEDSRAARKGSSLGADRITPELIGKLQALDRVAQARGQSLAQMALSWILKDERMTSVIIGASRVSQLEENVGTAGHTAFSAEELSLIDNILK